MSFVKSELQKITNCVLWRCHVWTTCRQEGDEYKLKLADVNLALGEVSLESGNRLVIVVEPPSSCWTKQRVLPIGPTIPCVTVALLQTNMSELWRTCWPVYSWGSLCWTPLTDDWQKCMNVLCRHTTQVSLLNVSSCHSHFSLGLAYSLAKRPDNAVEVCMYVCVLPYCVTINDYSNGIYCRNTRMLRMSWRREKVREIWCIW